MWTRRLSVIALGPLLVVGLAGCGALGDQDDPAAVEVGWVSLPPGPSGSPPLEWGPDSDGRLVVVSDFVGNGPCSYWTPGHNGWWPSEVPGVVPPADASAVPDPLPTTPADGACVPPT